MITKSKIIGWKMSLVLRRKNKFVKSALCLRPIGDAVYEKSAEIRFTEIFEMILRSIRMNIIL